MKKLLSLLLLLSFTLSLAACPAPVPDEGGESTAHVLTSPARDVYYCAENGVTYRRQPALYLPMRLAREPYAIYENEHGARLSFFSLAEGSEERYLMLADEEDLYPYYMITAEGYEMPSLAEMDPYQIVICTTEEEMFWLSPNVYDQIRTVERVRAIVSAYESGEAAQLPVLAEPTACVELIFVSALYEDFAYTCTYYEYEDGACYFKETATGRCVQVAGGLFEGYRLTEDAL
ncbi:MAG: hypothetical protein J6D31_00225 [Clostridia bacterium]|nr:hypothetical protein [Clostridia bacterium]